MQLVDLSFLSKSLEHHPIFSLRLTKYIQICKYSWSNIKILQIQTWVEWKLKKKKPMCKLFLATTFSLPGMKNILIINHLESSMKTHLVCLIDHQQWYIVCAVLFEWIYTSHLCLLCVFGVLFCCVVLLCCLNKFILHSDSRIATFPATFPCCVVHRMEMLKALNKLASLLSRSSKRQLWQIFLQGH